MKYVTLVLIGLLVQGCVYAPKTNKEKKESSVLACVHDLLSEDVVPSNAFEICRQIYSLRTVEEKQ